MKIKLPVVQEQPISITYRLKQGRLFDADFAESTPQM